MKNSTVLVTLAGALIGCAADGDDHRSASEPTRADDLLFLAYSTATLRPESFDSTAQDIRDWSSDLHDCATSAQARLSTLRSGSPSHCQDLEDQDSRQHCYGTDWLRISALVDAVVLVVEGKATFSSTPSGAALTLGKQLLGAEQWDDLQTDVLDEIKPVLACN